MSLGVGPRNIECDDQKTYMALPDQSMDMEAVKSMPLRSPAKEDIQAADFMLLFYRGEHPDDNESIGAHFIEDVAVNMEKFTQTFPRTCAACKPNDSKVPSRGQVRLSLMEDFNDWLPKCGLSVHQFASIDSDETFMRISMDDSEVESLYAEKNRIRLQVADEIRDDLGVIQDPDRGPTTTPYLSFSIDYNEEKLKRFGKPLFKTYHTRSQGGSIFRTVDRIRCLNVLFSKVLNFDVLVERKVLLAGFPVHYKRTLSELRHTWANFTCARFFDVLHSHQPLKLIRNYFGENLAFVFAWTGYTIRSFFVLTVCSVIFSIVYLLRRFDALDVDCVHIDIAWVTCLVLFGMGYSIRWVRVENQYCVEWDMSGNAQTSAVRAAYRGEFAESVENKKLRVRTYAPWKVYGSSIVTLVVTSSYFAFTASCSAAIYMLRPVLVGHFGSKGGPLVSMLVAAQISTCNAIWTPICNWLVWLENPKTNMDYYNSQVWKQFLFQAFNAYISFIYILFIQPFMVGCPVSYEGQHYFEACVDYCAESLVVTLATMALTQLIYMAIPYVSMHYSLKREAEELEKKFKDLIAAGEKSDSPRVVMPKRSFMEAQGKMTPYTPDDQIQDMLAMVITIGYVFLFACVAPLITLIGLFLLLLSLRVNAWKLTEVLRRPHPMRAVGIGNWNAVINLITWMGLFTSVGFIVLRSFPNEESLESVSFFPEGAALKKLMMFCVLEHVMIIIKIVTSAFWGDKREDTIVVEKRRKYLEDQLLLGTTHGFESRHHKPHFTGTADSLTQWSPLWDTVEHADDVFAWGESLMAGDSDV